MKHAKLSASGSSRWLNCAASVQAEEQYEDDTNIFSIEGSLAHEIADRCIKKDRDASYYEGHKVFKSILKDDHNNFFDGERLPLRITKEMCEYVQQYLDYVRAHETKETILYPEQRVDFSNYIPDGFGTSDNILIIPSERTAHIFDLKYGTGVQVFAKKNSQGMLYGVGTLNDYGFLHKIDKVVIHICQPRLHHFESWEISTKKLLKWAKWASKRAAKTQKKNPKFTAGPKQCNFCKHLHNCEALAEYTEKMIGAEFDEIGKLEAPDGISNERRNDILRARKIIEKFLTSVYTASLSLAETGASITGHKLVKGRSIRFYTEEAEGVLKKKLGKKKAYKPKALITLTEAEKLLGPKAFKDLQITDKSTPKNVLVPKEDKREEVVISNGFEDETEDEL